MAEPGENEKQERGFKVIDRRGEGEAEAAPEPERSQAPPEPAPAAPDEAPPGSGPRQRVRGLTLVVIYDKYLAHD